LGKVGENEMSQQTITINGTQYDAHTGMPIQRAQAMPVSTEAAPASAPPKAHHSQSVHSVTQKSQTLNRRVVQKTAKSPQQERPIIQKSPAITKFAPHPTGAKTQARTMSDIGPVRHPIETKVQQQMQQGTTNVAKPAPRPAQIIKQEAITEALANAPSHRTNHAKSEHVKKRPRTLSIASVSLALLLLGGYFTYLNMPSLSVRVAAAQAGVDASYPEYRPDGYSLHGPIAYSQGEVTMKFAANAGPQNFTVNQAKSNWDSSAVLDNYVKDKAGDNYITYNERGLTIYTFDGNAAWVNGGILYTINGNAPLSSDQIRRIATSM
jgi:hypothetical protein